MPRPLPERPKLEQLKHQAKTLLRNARAGQPDALRRFSAMPAFADRPPFSADGLALHDAQSVIAREHGFASWRALRDEVEARTLTFTEAADAFLRFATGGAAARAERLLALHPSIASSSLQAAIVLGDAKAVRSRLQADPELATRTGGPREWAPLLYACHTYLTGGDQARNEGLVAIARELCAAGADPKAEYHWDWHPELPRTALWGACCVVGSLALAEVLLEAGATPTDGVTAHIAGGGGNLAVLDLLLRYGLDVNGSPRAVPPLPYMLTWATDPAGPRWLLEHGADPNLAFGADQESALHVAARRWDVALVELLLAHGADPKRRRADGRTPYVLAALNGKVEIARRLEAAGAGEDLSHLDRFVAACARGARAEALAMLDARPSLPSELLPDHQRLLHRAAEAGDTAALDTMLACGFLVDARDGDGTTPLHRAAMAGHAEATRLLIGGGADVQAIDPTFSATPLVWAVEGRDHAGPGADHVEVARLLIAAGSPVEWQAPEGAPHQERSQEALQSLVRAAATP